MFVEEGAGIASNFSDDDYKAAGAKIVSAKEVRCPSSSALCFKYTHIYYYYNYYLGVGVCVCVCVCVWEEFFLGASLSIVGK